MSAEIKKLKGEFLREALLRGWTAPCQDATWLERAGVERMQRWFSWLYEPPDGLPLPNNRFLNHFSLGADPEFIFMQGGVREDARHLGLKAGLAFGADNNGRLVELRPEPSRSALSVLTSVWLTMHWLAAYVPNTPNYIWRSGAYAENDGLGGHLHIGRKQERFRDREARALDRIVHLLYTAGCYNRDEGRLRYRQAQGGHYGHQSDIREQPHGYEHRTFPSWLDTPWLAYLSMTLGKLAAASELVPVLMQEDGVLTQEQARAQIRLLLAYFKGVDDDARLAFAILAHRGFPVHVQGGDFKVNWGVFNGPLFNQKVRLPGVQPSSVPSIPALEKELACSMLEARLPEMGVLQPTWVPSELPRGYRQMLNHVADTRLLPGIGEWLVDICDHESRPVRVNTMNEGGRQFRFPNALRQLMQRKNLAEKFARLDITFDFGDLHEHGIIIGAGHGNLRNMLAARELIIEHELLPIWEIENVREDSAANWRKPPERPNPGCRLLSKLPEGPAPPAPPPAPEPQAAEVAAPENVLFTVNTDDDGWQDTARELGPHRVQYIRANGLPAQNPLTGVIEGNGAPHRGPMQAQQAQQNVGVQAGQAEAPAPAQPRQGEPRIYWGGHNIDDLLNPNWIDPPRQRPGRVQARRPVEMEGE